MQAFNITWPDGASGEHSKAISRHPLQRYTLGIRQHQSTITVSCPINKCGVNLQLLSCPKARALLQVVRAEREGVLVQLQTPLSSKMAYTQR